MRTSLFLLSLFSSTALAADVVLPVQGYLTDASDAPVDGSLDVTFRLYPDQAATGPLFTETLTVTFDSGAFTTIVGDDGGLDSEIFRLDQSLWLGIQLGGDAEMSPLQIGWAPMSAYAAHAGDAETLDGLGSADFLGADYQPDWTDVANRPAGLDDGDDVGLTAVDWSIITNRPSGLDDGDDVGNFVAGQGIDVTGAVISADGTWVDDRARAVCYDTESELTDALDDNYMPIDWRPNWTDIQGIPADIADGDGGGTAYDAGTGLALDGTTFSADQAIFEGWARAVCYDTVDELTTLLDPRYLPSDYVPSWDDLPDIPTGFADGIDNDAFAGVSCPADLSLISTGGDWACADLRVEALTTEDVVALLDGADLDLGDGSTVGGAEPYTDDDAIAAVQVAFPDLGGYLRDPLIQMGLDTDLCGHVHGWYGGMLRWPTLFDVDPIFVAEIDETIENNGATQVRAVFVNRDRAAVRCNNRSDALAWMAIEPGAHTIDGKMVQAGKLDAARTNDTIFFNPLFTEPPVVILFPGESNVWARIVGSNGVSTGGFQIQVGTNDRELYWIAMEPGHYEYGRYSWEAGKIADPDNGDVFNFDAPFDVTPAVLMTIVDTNSNGGTLTRLQDVSRINFEIYIDNNSSEFLNYFAFEERR